MALLYDGDNNIILKMYSQWDFIQNELRQWITPREKKNACFQGIAMHCLCEWAQGGGDDGDDEWGWVCECVNEVCLEVTGSGDGCVGVGWGAFWGVSRWVSEIWTSGIVSVHLIGQKKKGLIKFWKNTLKLFIFKATSNLKISAYALQHCVFYLFIYWRVCASQCFKTLSLT